MIDLTGLSKSFGPRVLWQDLTFTIEAGRMLALTGPSGSGKSTLLNCLGLLDTPTTGTMRHHDQNITRLSPRRARAYRRDTLGYLFQNYALIDNATVADNLSVAIKPVRSNHGSRPTLAQSLEQVGLAGRGDDIVHRLSGGEQQRVALARLIVKQPAIVLADEPTGALDLDNTHMVIATLRALADAGCAVVIATHDAIVRDLCDSVLQVGITTHPQPAKEITAA
ncbi:ATP-binding cassette domain-containing protein [Streptomyces meridianus]|uniref:ATP-binding cassette domain-containing protein n=1 Tax=Streptomyces meridianus TaxID=2938945 RepID=A0ABT0XAM0_9ACTN|nr:ATP-binding cassette domain-containing protein [Streptomyces meridianus]MCM2578854.1 ATP-binding cassette domain-containing protein [Streptomyces meridianus]